MIRIFISYRRSDSSHQVGRLYDHLAAHFGPESIFKDVDTIPLGRDFRAVLREQVGRCDGFLAVIGDGWLTAIDESGRRRLDDPNDYVRMEIESALERQVPLIPVLVGDSEIPPTRALPEGLRELPYRTATRLRNDPDFRNDVNRLIRGIELSVAKPVDYPEHFGRYRILQRLGQSGKGTMFMAENRRLGRFVALRVPDFGPKGCVDPARFLEQGRHVAALRCLPVCPIVDTGTIDGHAYLAMAFIEGKSLGRTIPAGGLPPRQVVVMGGKLARSLREMHERGVVHGDLKTSNVIFNSAGPKHDPVIVGFGRAARADVASIRDVHGLGLILRELLTGPPTDLGPARAATPPTSMPLPRELDPRLGAIIRRATDPMGRDGCATMGDLELALVGSFRTLAAKGPPAGGSGQPGGWRTRNGIGFDETS